MIRKRIRSYKIGNRGDVKGWSNALCDVPAFIIGNAPSLEDLDLSPLENYFTIGLNRAFYKIDPTILMWQDAEVWWNHRAEITRLLAIKYCRDVADPKGRCYRFKLINGDYKLPKNASKLYGRGSTGPLGFQLAYVMGCNPIILLGMDCKYSNGKTDFYGKNPSHKPHSMRNCRRGLQWMERARHERDIINCSENEVFDNVLSLEDVLSDLKDAKRFKRKTLIKRITGSVN